MTNNTVNLEKENVTQSGFTLIEMIISILVATIVLSILMQQLVMTVGIKRRFELDNRMANESYYIAEQIRFNIFNLQPHSIELMPSAADQVVINIVHEYDIKTGAYNSIIRDYSNPQTDVLIWDMTTEELTYNGESFHSANIKIIDDYTDGDGVVVTGSSLTIVPLNPDLCLIEPGNDVCGQGILKLTLVIQIVLDDGSRLDPQEFITTIIV